MKGAVKECTLCTIVIGRTIVKLFTAVRTIHRSGEHATSSGFCFSMPLLTDLLNLLKDFIFNDTFMRVWEDCLILNRIIPLLLVSNRVGVSFEVDHTSSVYIHGTKQGQMFHAFRYFLKYYLFYHRFL